MYADVDFDIITHLGNVRNVNMCHRGVYSIRVSLFYGNSKIAPVGMFSAPTDFSSSASGSEIPPPRRMLEKYSPGDESFTSRAFVVRYRDEVHELNEAVHWRLTVPKVELFDGRNLHESVPVAATYAETTTAPPFCKELLRIEFELYCSQLVMNKDNSDKDMDYDVDSFLPVEPIQYEKVSQQTLCVQHAASGLHEYFPVRFAKNYLTDLDAFIHCGVTAVRCCDFGMSTIATLPSLTVQGGGSKTGKTDETLAFWYGTDSDNSKEINAGGNNWLHYGGAEIMDDFFKTEICDARYSPSCPAASSPCMETSSSSKKAHSFITTTVVDGLVQPFDNSFGAVAYRAPKKDYGGRYNAGKAMAANLMSPSRRASSVVTTGHRGMDDPNSTSKQMFQGDASTLCYVTSGADSDDDTVSMASSSSCSSSSTVQSLGTGGGKTARKLLNVMSTGAADGAGRVKQLIKGSSQTDGTCTTDGTDTRGKVGSLEQLEHNNVVIIQSGLNAQLMMESTVETNSISDLRAAATVYRACFCACGLHRDQIVRLYYRVTGPLVANFNLLNAHVDALLAFNARLEWLKLHGAQVLRGRKNVIFTQNNFVTSASGPEIKIRQVSLLESTATQIIDDLMTAESLFLVKRRLLLACRASDAQTMARWAMLWVSLPHLAGPLKSKLEPEYIRRMKQFWRRQALVNVCGIAAMTKQQQIFEDSSLPVSVSRSATIGSVPTIGATADDMTSTFPPPLPPPDESSMNTTGNIGNNFNSGGGIARGALLKDYYSSFLTNLVVFEHHVLTNGRLCQLCLTSCGDSSSSSSRRMSMLGHVQHCHLHWDTRYYGRGLSVFDQNVHRNPSRLPTLVIEQYTKKFQHSDCASLVTHGIETSRRGDCFNSVRGGAFYNCESEGQDDGQSDSSLQALDEVYYCMSQSEGAFGDGLSVDGAVMQMFTKEISRDATLAIGGTNKNPENALTLEQEQTQRASAPICNPVVNLLISRKPLVQLLESSNVYEDTAPLHLVVLQHGFCGQPGDMTLLRSVLALEFPKHTRFLAAASNAGEVKSSESIDIMGKRLALEVLNFCRNRMPELLSPYDTSARISFIGHSAGGLIIRRCLQEISMAPLLNKLHVYMSLASPHLGTLYAESQLISTGMWAMLKIKKAQTLKELRLEDIPLLRGTLEDTVIYKLSCNDALSHFHRVILVSSPLDTYVPVYSARIQSCPKAELNPVAGAIIVKMSANLLSQVEPERLLRVSIEDPAGEQSINIDNIIGRTAHISYLDNIVVAEQLLLVLYPYFV